MRNLSGKTFGQLIVVELDKINTKRHRWICACKCGNTKSIQENHLLSGNTKSCGCLHKRQGKDSPFFKGCGELPLDYFSILKRGAKGGGKFNRKSKQFDLTLGYLWNLFLKQNRCCALTKLELSFGGKAADRKRKETNKMTASLDRIDSTKGYVEGNVQWVHKEVNLMKNDLPLERFIDLCKKIADHA